MPPETNHAADNAVPAVRVTLDVIYETVQAIDKKVDPIPSTLRDHEARLRALERQVWMWVGAASIGGGGLTVLISRAIGS